MGASSGVRNSRQASYILDIGWVRDKPARFRRRWTNSQGYDSKRLISEISRFELETAIPDLSKSRFPQVHGAFSGSEIRVSRRCGRLLISLRDRRRTACGKGPVP
jgi:hypothetical protein